MASHQLVVRVPSDLFDDLERVAHRIGRPRSAIVREALISYLGRGSRRPTRAAERVSHLIGSLESGIPDLAEDHRRYLLESIRRGR